ncbi:hypothetical protein IPH19_02715 [Candidatus Uhrbacteria bacterium]|nr:MAG: hypothetical protein IPH19_02715 [Candidatus Uhrbacteria bacterium]
MEDFRLIRVDIGDEWERRKLVALFRESLRKNGLVSDDYLYHAFDANASVNGATAIDLIGLIGCETRAPEHYTCGVADGLKARSKLYNPLETAVMLGKPGLLIYKRRSLVLIDGSASTYRFKGRDYMRGLVAVLLAKRPRHSRVPEIHPDL